MKILENVDLSAYSTMRLGGKARYLSEASSDQELLRLVEWAKSKKQPFIVIGQGSNIVWRDEGFEGLVIVNKILGRKVLGEDSSGATIRLGAGENWDEVVAWTIEHDWGGLELLSKIPGTVGAAPIQNIGAYGQELSKVLVEVEALDTKTMAFGAVVNAACNFGYRTSRFKTTDKGRYAITAVTLKLNKDQPKPPFYESLEEYFKDNGITSYTRQVVRDAVAAIRSAKLPDPSAVNNNGSFFINPVVGKELADKIASRYPDIVSWPTDDGQVKLSAGWLIEQAGFKDIHDPATGMATWKGSALVMVNERASKTADLLAFKKKIVDKVNAMFGVNLQQEPELLP